MILQVPIKSKVHFSPPVCLQTLRTVEQISPSPFIALPKPPGTPIVTETTATSVTITWDSGNPDPVSYYIIQYRAKAPDSKYETVDSITTTRYSIGGLYPNTEYEIRVSAVNSIGQGPSSTRVEARTGEQAPASPPRNVQARIISKNTVMVRWEEPEEPNGQVSVDFCFVSCFVKGTTTFLTQYEIYKLNTSG